MNNSVGLVWWLPDILCARGLARSGRVQNEGTVYNVSNDPDGIPCGTPSRCLAPKAAECANLLSPTCPSSSYVTYGTYRVEFTFTNAGQSAANPAAVAMEAGTPVQSVSYSKRRERLLADEQVLEVTK